MVRIAARFLTFTFLSGLSPFTYAGTAAPGGAGIPIEAISGILKAAPQWQPAIISFLNRPNFDAVSLERELLSAPPNAAGATALADVTKLAPEFTQKAASPASTQDSVFVAERLAELHMVISRHLTNQKALEGLEQAARQAREQLSAEQSQKIADKMARMAQALEKGAALLATVTVGAERSATLEGKPNENSFVRRHSQLSKPAIKVHPVAAKVLKASVRKLAEKRGQSESPNIDPSLKRPPNMTIKHLEPALKGFGVRLNDVQGRVMVLNLIAEGENTDPQYHYDEVWVVWTEKYGYVIKVGGGTRHYPDKSSEDFKNTILLKKIPLSKDMLELPKKTLVASIAEKAGLDGSKTWTPEDINAFRQKLEASETTTESAVQARLEAILTLAGIKPDEVQGRQQARDFLAERRRNGTGSGMAQYLYDQEWVLWTKNKGYRIRLSAGTRHSPGKPSEKFRDKSIVETSLPNDRSHEAVVQGILTEAAEKEPSDRRGENLSAFRARLEVSETANELRRSVAKSSVQLRLDSILASLSVVPGDIRGRQMVEDFLADRQSRGDFSDSTKYLYDEEWVVWTDKKGYRIKIGAGTNTFPDRPAEDFETQAVDEVPLPLSERIVIAIDSLRSRLKSWSTRLRAPR